MKKFKLFFILTIICCLLVSMVGCGKIENKQSDSEIITETISTTAKIYQIKYTVGSNLFDVDWVVTLNVESYDTPINHVVTSEGNFITEYDESGNSNTSRDILCTSYIPIKKYEKCKKIFNNKEEVKVTLIINRTPSKDGDYTTVSRKVIPNF